METVKNNNKKTLQHEGYKIKTFETTVIDAFLWKGQA